MNIDYYDNPQSHGEYQYVTLEEVINNYMMSRGDDDYTNNEPRYKILYQAKRGVRELYYDVVREIKAIELELSPTLNVIVPPDFVNAVRISWVDDSGQLHPMSVDRTMVIADKYLQDHEYELLFDDEGEVLKADEGIPKIGGGVRRYSVCSTPFTPNIDRSKFNKNSTFNIDKAAGIIQFSSDARSKRIVLEYISDGLYTGNMSRGERQIRIHKFAESALVDYIYYGLVKNRRNVPMNEKIRARKEFYNNRRIAKRRVNSLNYQDLIQVFKGSTKWIKN